MRCKMVKKHECVVVAESREAALELTALAAELCDKVAVIAVGDRSAAVNAGFGVLHRYKRRELHLGRGEHSQGGR